MRATYFKMNWFLDFLHVLYQLYFITFREINSFSCACLEGGLGWQLMFNFSCASLEIQRIDYDGFCCSVDLLFSVIFSCGIFPPLKHSKCFDPGPGDYIWWVWLGRESTIVLYLFHLVCIHFMTMVTLYEEHIYNASIFKGVENGWKVMVTMKTTLIACNHCLWNCMYYYSILWVLGRVDCWGEYS